MPGNHPEESIRQIIGCRQSVWFSLFPHLSVDVLFFIGKETKGSSYKEARKESKQGSEK
jgi:hypothetical protein